MSDVPFEGRSNRELFENFFAERAVLLLRGSPLKRTTSSAIFAGLAKETNPSLRESLYRKKPSRRVNKILTDNEFRQSDAPV
jgi:hypothetical protein